MAGRPGSPPGDRRWCSLVVASLEIGKILADRGRARFRAQGTCMYPCVWPGDLLCIESRTVEQVAVGDIAVCRRPGFLFGHRTIRKGVRNGRPYIVTRADRTSQGDDGLTYDEDLLGIVTAIERNGRRVHPIKPRYRWPMRGYLSARLVLLESSRVVRAWLIDSLAYVQRTTGYRRAAGLWFAAARGKVSYVVRLPLQGGQAHDLYRPLPPDEFDVAEPTWQGRAVDCWTLSLHLNGSRRPAGWATLVSRSPECPLPGWWVNDLQVRSRYRGAGLEEALLGKAEEILARRGATLRRSKE